MKFLQIFLAIPVFLISASLQAEPIQQRVTHEELLERQNKARKMLVEQQQTNRVDPAELKERKKKDRGDIISRSTILSYGSTWTIVPKGAVLHVPSFLSARVDGEKSKRFVSWKNFYQSNRGWIHLQNVKMQQARGKEAMPEEVLEAYPKIGRVVVAVCHGGPISVVPPKVEEEEKTAEAAGS